MSANNSVSAMRLTAQAVTVSGADFDNQFNSAAVIVIDITAITGTIPTVLFTIEGKDPVSGKYYPILVSASLTTVSTTVLRVYPAATAAAGLVANDLIPKTFRVTATIGGTTPAITATVGVLLNGY